MVYTVKQARQLAGKTQSEMADLMGISRDIYRKIELNPDRATVAQAKMFCEVTKMPMDELCFFTTDSN